jgi:aminocarboxymuconate-semialdehyde decarboxylase
MAAMCKAYPGRFYGLASLPLSDIKSSLYELDRATQDLGLSGVMIGSNVAGVQLDDGRFEPIWRRINERKTPVVEHPMFPTMTPEMNAYMLPIRVGFVYDTTTAMARLIYSGVLERYPDFPFIIAHTGGTLLMLLQRLDNGYHLFPECREHISQLPSVYAKRLYYDTASFYGPAIEMAMKIVGPDHLMWGSDDPFLGATTGYIDELEISADDKSKILGGNAQRIFGLS